MHLPTALRTPLRNKCARLILGCTLLSLLAGGAYAKGPKWEYRVVAANLNARQLTVLLNNQAAEGWELVQFTDNRFAIFRKAK